MIYELMKARRSVRRFRSEPPPRTLLVELIEAAVTAPSASNKQPWRFLIVRDQAKIEELADAVEEGLERIVAALEQNLQAEVRAYGDYFSRFRHAPTLIVPIYRPLETLSRIARHGLDAQQREAVALMEVNSGIISTSLALQNLLLAAHERGLGASVMTGPMVALPAIRLMLELQPSWQILAFVPVGYPDEQPEPPQRKAVDRVIRWIDASS